jgi:predicted phage terminase large subunit-like protein
MFELTECTDPQARFWADEAKFRLFCGGLGSGKTFAGAIELARMPAGSTGMVVAPTFPMLKTASLRTFMQIFRPTRIVKSFNKQDMEMTLAGNRTVFWRSADDPEKLRGPNLGFIWIDEAAMCDPETWPICVSRLREQPARIWMTSTPKGVRNWMYEPVKKGVVSMTNATSASNHFNPSDFVESVAMVATADWQRQELLGEFVEPGGALYKRSWFKTVNEMPGTERLSVRAWDCAATSGGGDWSVGLRMHRINNAFYVDSVIRGQWGPDELDAIQRQTAGSDGQAVTILLEREPGSAGKRANQYVKNALGNYNVLEEPPSGSKYERAKPSAKEAARGNLVLVNGNWITSFLDEVADFNGEKDGVDDQVDAFSLAFNYLHRMGGFELS